MPNEKITICLLKGDETWETTYEMESDGCGKYLVRDTSQGAMEGLIGGRLGDCIVGMRQREIDYLNEITSLTAENERLSEENKNLKYKLSHRWSIDIRKFPNWVRQRLSKSKKTS